MEGPTMTNSTKLASQLMFMSAQFRTEAELHRGDRRDQLLHGSRQLTCAFHNAYSTDPRRRDETVALVEGAIDYLVGVITARTEHQLTKGTP